MNSNNPINNNSSNVKDEIKESNSIYNVDMNYFYSQTGKYNILIKNIISLVEQKFKDSNINYDLLTTKHNYNTEIRYNTKNKRIFTIVLNNQNRIIFHPGKEVGYTWRKK